MKRFLLGVLFGIYGLIVFAQVDIGTNELLLQGYHHKISGTDFNYHSAIPTSKESMLVRATNGKQTMEWVTQTLPEKVEAEYVTFVWLASVGCNVANVQMTLSINDRYTIEFYTQRSTNWKEKNKEGMELRWFSDYVDKAGDR